MGAFPRSSTSTPSHQDARLRGAPAGVVTSNRVRSHQANRVTCRLMATLSVKIRDRSYTIPEWDARLLAELIASGAAPKWLEATGSTWIRTDAITEIRAPKDAELE